jgi:hypothetical protein
VTPAPRLVAVILVTWNNFNDTAECLASIRHLDHPDVLPIVVDNGSSDGTVALLREQFPGVTLLENRANLGFAAANNIGMRHALEQGAQFGLLNNDTVVDPGLSRFLAAAGKCPRRRSSGEGPSRRPAAHLGAAPLGPALAGFVNEGRGPSTTSPAASLPRSRTPSAARSSSAPTSSGRSVSWTSASSCTSRTSTGAAALAPPAVGWSSSPGPGFGTK